MTIYDQVKGRKVKVVAKDGSRITVTTGIFSEISEEFKQIVVLEEGTNLPIIIAISTIEKLEVLE